MEAVNYDLAAGSFQHNGRTYVGYIRQGDKRKAITKLGEDERKALLEAAYQTFQNNPVDDVSRAVFSAYGSRVHIDYYQDRETEHAFKKVDIRLSEASAETARKLYHSIGASGLLFKSSPSGSFIDAGFQRVRGEQTCFANAFLQLHREVKLGDELQKRRGEPVDQYNARKKLWQALKDLQEEVKKAKASNRSVSVDLVKDFLNKATGLQTTSTHPWNDFKQGQDFIDFWNFVRSELALEMMPQELVQGESTDHALTLTPSNESTVASLLKDQILNVITPTQAPKNLPLYIKRTGPNGKTLAPIKIAEKMSCKVGTREIKYRLVSAVAHIGTTVNTGHYIAYKRNKKGKYLEYNDGSVRSFSAQDACRELATTAALLIYELVE